MIRPPVDIPVVHLCREPIDMRKSIDGLAALVSHGLQRDPFPPSACHIAVPDHRVMGFLLY